MNDCVVTDSCTTGLVSFVIPTYNRAQSLGTLAQSIICQTYRPIELIIVDDGSRDDTTVRLHSLESDLQRSGISTKFRSIEHSGQDAAINEGLRHVTGEYFFWCDDDDLLMPDAVGSKVEWLCAHPEAGFVRCDALYVDEVSGKALRNAYADGTLKGENILEHLLDDTMPPLAGTYMIRVSLLRRMLPGGRIREIGEGQNLQLLIPAALLSPCGYIDRVGLHYIIHEDSHSNRRRSLPELLARNERFRALKLELLGPGRGGLAALVHKTHDAVRMKLLESAVKLARESNASSSGKI